MPTMADLIVTTLREPEDRRLRNNLDRIVELNCEVTQDPVRAFLYRGQLYRHSDAPNGRLMARAIDPSLYDEIEEHLNQQATMARDLQMITQVLRPALTACIDDQDVRDVLPECLVAALGWFRELERTRPPVWSLLPDSRAMKQYLKVLPQIEVYTAARFLY